MGFVLGFIHVFFLHIEDYCILIPYKHDFRSGDADVQSQSQRFPSLYSYHVAQRVLMFLSSNPSQFPSLSP